MDTVRNFNSGLENLRRYGVVGGYDFARDPEDMTSYLADEAKKRGHQIPVDYDSKLKGFAKSKYMRPLMACLRLLSLKSGWSRSTLSGAAANCAMLSPR